MALTGLTVKVLDASNNVVSSGLVYKIASFQYSLRLDEVGTFQLSLPYTDAQNATVFQKGLYVVVEDGYTEIFRGIIDSRNRNNEVLNIRGRDILAELAFIETGSNHEIEDTLLGTAIQQIIALAPTWTANTPTISSINVQAIFKGKSILEVLSELAKTYGYHIRRIGIRQLEIGTFGLDKGYILANPLRITRGVSTQPKLMVIENMEEVTTDSEITNRIIPYGGTYTVNGISTTLQLAPGIAQSGYVVDTRLRHCATEHFIQNNASIAVYGVREKVMSFPEITPGGTVTAVDSKFLSALGNLLSRAVNYLERYAQPQIAYRVDTVADDADDLLPGDMVKLQYRDEFTDINSVFFIVDKQINYSGTSKNTAFNLSSVERVVLDDADMLLAGLQKLQEVRFQNL